MTTPPKNPTNKTPPDPERPKNLPHGRWLGDFPDLSAAELRLVECCRKGDVWAPNGWDWKNPVRPKAGNAANRIRAELIRFLALGGDALHPVHEEGLNIAGAWITKTLTLEQSRARVPLGLRHCNVDNRPIFTATHLPQLSLSGSSVPGLMADGMNVAGDVFVCDGFSSIGEVRLLGAKIGGNLECNHSNLSNADGNALHADEIDVAGDVFMRDGFTAAGAIRLVGARIGGDFDCRNGVFSNAAGLVLSLERITVTGGVFMRNAKIGGAVSMVGARIGTLVDDSPCWISGGHHFDGLHYDRIIGPLDAASRIAWLKSQRADQIGKDDWSPQPWEQLIKVLREMGHPRTAAEIAMEKQHMMRAADQIGTRIPRTDFKRPLRRKLDAWWTKLSNFLAHAFHDFYGWIAGYGHRPSRIAWRMLTVWLGCSLLYWAAADGFAAFGPANPAITSPTLYPEADLLCGHGNETGKQRWTECPGVPDEYSTFQPFIYSLDVILPLIDICIEEVDWAPIAEGPTGSDLLMGVIVRWVMWFEILFGWVASLMFVAIVSRLVDKD